MVANVKKILVCLLPVLASSAVRAQEITCFKADFDAGIPAGCIVEDYAELPVGTGFRTYVGQQWFCGDVFGTNGKAAMSTSHRIADLPSDNWLITPKLSIGSPDIWLAWDARSLHYDLRDGYKVMISETGSDAIDVVTSDGTTTRLMEDSIICSEFPRTLLVEKCTGTWCTSCPDVIPYINQLKERYRDELVCIESHSAYINTSGLAYELYDNALDTKNYPAIFYNRNLKSPQYSAGYTDAFRKILLQPTRALIELEAATADDNFIDVTAQTVFAGDQDNEDGHFRIGFAVIEKRLQLPYNLQKNNATLLSNQEYSKMSSPIEKDFMFYHDVVRGTPSAFAGEENSLPRQIEGGCAHTFRTRIQIPATVSDKKNIAIVAFVLDVEQGEVLNTTEVRPDDTQTGIGHGVKEEALPVSVRPGKNGGIEISLSRKNIPCEVEVMDVTGRVLAVRRVTEPLANVAFQGQGCYLVRVSQGKKMTVKKIIL